ncbi:MAG: DNA primase [Deltaproteobacteria bacterium]|nr:DNA primase [Deltaproteobacteria bacterium]
MGAIDEVKQKIDIVEVIGQDITLTKAGRTFKGLCPFHAEKNPSFYVYPEQQSWHCFGCNKGGDAFSFIMKKQNIDFGEALRQLAQKAGVVIPTRFEPGVESEEKQKLYQVNQAAAQYFHNLLLNSPAGKKAQGYTAGRGFTEQTIKDFHLGYSPDGWEGLKKYLTERDYTEKELLNAGLIIEAEGGKTHDRFRHKLMFPIMDIRGRVTGFGGRALDDSMPKYTNSPQTPLFDKSGTLYGINLAKDAVREQDTAVIVEGYMDVITAHQNGFNNAVASMGTAVTEKQVGILKRLTRNMALALDADAAGEEAMLRTVGYENTLDAEIKVIILPEGKDPDDVIKEDIKVWQELVAESVPIVDYTFDRATAGLDLTTAKGKASARDRLLPIIGEIKDNVRRAHYLQKLAGLLNVSERDLEADLARIRPGQVRRQATTPPTPVPVRSSFSSPREEFCLALLLQHPELKSQDEGLLPDYFENSENKEIFIAWQQRAKIEAIRKKLEPAIHEHLDSLATRKLLSNNLEQKYARCALELREKFLRNLTTKIEAVLALEAQSGGTAAELAKLKEMGTDVSSQLGKVLAQKSRLRFEQRG